MMTAMGIALSLVSAEKQLNLDDLTWTGRWERTREGRTGQWPAIGFKLRTDSAVLKLVVEDFADGKPHENGGPNSNYLQVLIDGNRGPAIALKPGSHEYAVKVSGAGMKTVGIYRRTESFLGKIRIAAVRLAPGAKLVRLPSAKRLDFYGDSDATGYGVDTPRKEDHFSPQTEDATQAFAMVAARELGWDLNLIGASGWGIYRGFGGETESAIPDVARRRFIFEPDSVTDEPAPAAIMVMLGDNDFNQGDPGPAFDKKYLEFVRGLRARAPKAPIFLCVGTSMTPDPPKRVRIRVGEVIDEIKKSMGEANIHRVDIDPYQPESDGWGADWHTGKAGHLRIGKQMAAAIRAVLRGERSLGRVKTRG